jgi:putative DNA primase/helicase
VDTVYANKAQQAAVDYRQRGWSPIRLKGKVPSEPWAAHQQESMTAEEIACRPWPGVGIVTGQISGLVVLDADSPEAEAELKRRGHPVTPMVRTARGLHVYFAHPGGELPTRIGLGEGLDLKGDGGYVAAPPTRHPSGAHYEWIIPPEEAEPAELPAWATEQVRLRARRASREDLGGEAIPNGSRNTTLTSIGGGLRRQGLDEAAIRAALLGVNTAKCKPPLPEAEVAKIAASMAQYEPPSNGSGTARPAGRAEPSYNLTDLGNAQRFVRDHSRNVRFCYAWGRWIVWDSKRWAVDDSGAVVRMIKESVRRIYAAAAAEEDDKKRKALDDHARRSESKTRITDALYLARSEPGVPVTPEQLDANAWLLNTASGTVDLRTGKMREHRREDLITKIAPVEYDPTAEAPRFSRFLREIFDGDEDLIAFVRRFAGYSLTGSTEERVFAILHGRGRNGKTTLVELLEGALGDYAATTDTETILAKRYQGIGNEVAALKGARFVATAEVERGRALAESKVKQLTGSDTVTARFLYAEPFSFKPEFKLWLSTNNKPVIRGTDDAIWDRIRLIPFTQRFEGAAADAKLPEKLRAEMPGVLAWMVQGCIEWQRDGLGEPDKVVAATEGYRTEMDTLAAFVDECCIVRPEAWCKFADLYTAYTGWCEEANEHPEKKRRFADSLTERGYAAEKGAKNVAIRRGIALRHEGNPDPSGVTDPDPNSGPDAPHPAPERANNGNPSVAGLSNGNPENTCKNAGNPERVTEGYRESKNFGLVAPCSQSVEKTVTVGNSVTQEFETSGWFRPAANPTPRTPEDLLSDPPEWLASQLEQCRANPDSLCRPTAVAISTEVYGTAERWQEVLPVLDAHIGPVPRRRREGEL